MNKKLWSELRKNPVLHTTPFGGPFLGICIYDTLTLEMMLVFICPKSYMFELGYYIMKKA